MKVKDLNPNARNPRKISNDRLEALKKSVEKFGDLGGIVFNRRTGNLIAGHQRSKTLPPGLPIKIEQKHETPTKAQTVAEGYIEHNGERIRYREVDADEKWEMEALLAANKHGGEWDADILRVAVRDIPGLDLEIAGFQIPELKAMQIEIPEFKPPTLSSMVNGWSDGPVATDDGSPWGEATSESESEGGESEEEEGVASGSDEDADAAYLKENPGPDERLEKERIPSMVNTEASKNAFQSVKETTEVLNKKFMVIIDCPSEDAKQSLKEKLRPLIEEAGAKIF